MRCYPTRLLFWLCASGLLWPGRMEAAHVNIIELDNEIISPVTQQYIESAIDRSEAEAATCLVLKLDTPGGLLESTRGIVKRMMNAEVPIVVFVAPSGSRAGSAGVFITLAAHVAAMAPSTTIGAAHPVSVGEAGPIRKLVRRITRMGEEEAKRGGEKSRTTEEEIVEEEERNPMAEKIINDTVAWVTTIAKAHGRNEAWAQKAVTESFSVTETDAVKERIVDLIAADVPDLLKQIDGRQVIVKGTPVALATAQAALVTIPMSRRQQFLTVITHPNVAYLLMMLGTLGLIFEFTHPGIGFPGIAGLICLLLALYAFQALPVSVASVGLILVGLLLLIAELSVVSHGLLAVGGTISLTLGSLMLFESPDAALRVSTSVVAPTVITLSAIILVVLQRALRVQRYRVTTGVQGLIGEIGEASTALAPEGQVFVHGELWNASSRKPVGRGALVRVTRVEGLRLVVEPVDKGGR